MGFPAGVGEGLPHWLQTGAVIYIEEQGKLAGGTAFPDVWYQRALRPGALQFRKRYPAPYTPAVVGNRVSSTVFRRAHVG